MARYQALPSALFQRNRERFCAALPPNAIAIFYANDFMPRSGDTHFPFRQNADLFYLSGLDQEDVVLVLYPDCPKGEAFREVVFTKQTSDLIRVWEGYKYTREQVREISGVQQVFWLESMENVLNEMILLADVVYVNGNENDRAHSPVEDQNTRRSKELQAKYPLHRFERSQPILKQLRMIKSHEEIEVMQIACNITDKAFRRVLAETRPEVMEYEIEAAIAYEFLRAGANGHAYNPIIAGGPNACILHYNDNNQALRDGDLLLLDFGAEYANYAADLSRTIPVNGRFTPRQRAVYEAVLRVKKAAEAMLVPGNNLNDYSAEVGKVMESELIGLGLLDPHAVAQQNPNMPLYKRYFMHGTSHHLGLDVHDLCARYDTFKAGMVFTCEPGIYIPEEGIGIRLEDDLVIMPQGPAYNLMAHIPIEADHIETLMNAH